VQPENHLFLVQMSVLMKELHQLKKRKKPLKKQFYLYKMKKKVIKNCKKNKTQELFVQPWIFLLPKVFWIQVGEKKF
jgi:hypothetical protein